MIDYSKVQVGQVYWYSCLRFTNKTRRDKINKSRSIKPVQLEIKERVSSGGWWGILKKFGTSVFINISTSKFLFATKEEAVEYWNYNIQDAIEFQEFHYQESVKYLKKNMIQDDKG